MNPSTKRSSPDATSAPPVPKKKAKCQVEMTPSGIAIPQRTLFDPWNSSSTGHQRAENNLSGSTRWRDSRNLKLKAQYKAGRTGGDRIADTVGAGSEAFGKDGRKVNGGWEKGAPGLRKGGQLSLFEAIERKPTTKEKEDRKSCGEVTEKLINEPSTDREQVEQKSVQEEEHDELDLIPPSYQQDSGARTEDDDDPPPPKQIFTNLVFYINGSTAPLVSDHKLKNLISIHGGSLSISHTRKTVTHVIIGNPHNHFSDGLSSTRGTGGGLAGTKIQKEIVKTRGKGVKFIGAGWVLESIKAGKRVSELRFQNVKVGGSGQVNVFEQFRTSKPGATRLDKSSDT